jgi:hypothetical protein
MKFRSYVEPPEPVRGGAGPGSGYFLGCRSASTTVAPAAASNDAWQRWRADVLEPALSRTAQPANWSPFTSCPAV